MNSKINLDNIKVAIFDFDQTLAMHVDSNYKIIRDESEESFINFYLDAYLKPNDFYETIEPCNPYGPLLKLINVLREKNVKIYCVSGMKFSFHLKAKEAFVHKHYGDDIDVISCKSQKMKIDASKILTKVNDCSLNEVMFVDDIDKNIKRFKKCGILGLKPEDIEKLL